MAKHWQATTACVLVAAAVAVIGLFSNIPQLFIVTFIILVIGYAE